MDVVFPTYRIHPFRGSTSAYIHPVLFSRCSIASATVSQLILHSCLPSSLGCWLRSRRLACRTGWRIRRDKRHCPARPTQKKFFPADLCGVVHSRVGCGQRVQSRRGEVKPSRRPGTAMRDPAHGPRGGGAGDGDGRQAAGPNLAAAAVVTDRSDLGGKNVRSVQSRREQRKRELTQVASPFVYVVSKFRGQACVLSGKVSNFADPTANGCCRQLQESRQFKRFPKARRIGVGCNKVGTSSQLANNTRGRHKSCRRHCARHFIRCGQQLGLQFCEYHIHAFPLSVETAIKLSSLHWCTARSRAVPTKNGHFYLYRRISPVRQAFLANTTEASTSIGSAVIPSWQNLRVLVQLARQDPSALCRPPRSSH